MVAMGPCSSTAIDPVPGPCGRPAGACMVAQELPRCTSRSGRLGPREGCLDNIDIDPEKAGLADAAAVAAALMHRGNAEAYELGRKLSRLVK